LGISLNDIPYINEDDLRDRGERFLRKHNALGQIPVPIERIIEEDLGMDIIPIQGLRDVCDLCEVDGFISSDLQSITLDRILFSRNQENRYRFSLAHELAHALLHKDILSPTGVTSIEEYRAFRVTIDDHAYSRFEWQANWLGGVLLVPPSVLRQRFDVQARRVQEQGYALRSLPGEAIYYLADILGREFQVSREVMRIRIQNDSLFP